jgi:hypothetical protein
VNAGGCGESFEDIHVIDIDEETVRLEEALSSCS